MDGTLLVILAVFFGATFIRSALGFGEALIAVPLLAFVMPVKVAAPVAVLISITVALVVVIQDWRQVHFRSVGWLILTTLIGTPLGLWLLTAIPESAIKAILATVIMAFSAFSLMNKRPIVLKNDRLAWIFGFFAGVLGGAYAMNGPPLVIYGALRRWTPQQFRATLQGYFLPASVFVMVGYGLTGLWTATVNYYFGLTLPCVAVAIVLGRIVNRRMSGHAFLTYVHLGLLVTGAVLLFESLG